MSLQQYSLNSNDPTAHYACAIIIRDGKVLLGRRTHFRARHPNCWDFIGGKIENGETPEQALRRELDEEVAISPLKTSYLDKIEDADAGTANPPVYHFFRVYDWQGGEPVINNHEHSHLEWFTLQQACDLSNLALPQYRSLLGSAIA